MTALVKLGTMFKSSFRSQKTKLRFRFKSKPNLDFQIPLRHQKPKQKQEIHFAE